MKYIFRKLHIAICLFTFVLLAAYAPFACAVQTDMPFNGKAVFHEIVVEIPNSYIRDSTQSDADFWLFEKGFYSKCIMLSRKDLSISPEKQLSEYMEYLKAQGATSRRCKFLERSALQSHHLRNGILWQEMIFVHGSSLYAIAIDGGSREEFESLLSSVHIHDGSELPAETSPADDSLIDRLKRYFGE